MPNPKRQRLAESWNHFAQTLPPGIVAAVREEFRRAFYAGSLAFFGHMAEVLDPSRSMTEADIEEMREMRMEIQRFFATAKQGPALH